MVSIIGGIIRFTKGIRTGVIGIGKLWDVEGWWGVVKFGDEF